MDNKYIAAICASPAMVLSAAGIEEDRYITSYPGEDFENMLDKANYVEELVVVDGNLITSRGPATAFKFAFEIAKYLGLDPNKVVDEFNGFLFQHTSRISLDDISEARKNVEENTRKVKSPYTIEHKEKFNFWPIIYIILGILLLSLILLSLLFNYNFDIIFLAFKWKRKEKFLFSTLKMI